MTVNTFHFLTPHPAVRLQDLDLDFSNVAYLVLSSLFLAPQASSHVENFTPNIAGAKRCPKDMPIWVHSSDRPLTKSRSLETKLHGA